MKFGRTMSQPKVQSLEQDTEGLTFFRFLLVVMTQKGCYNHENVVLLNC